MNASGAIIILNWNGADETLACLRSLAAQDLSDWQVIVVDNGSADDSVARVRSAFPAATLLATGQNLGYAGGNNVGIHHALGQGAAHLCILNNDVVLAAGALQAMLDVLVRHPDAGVVTPLVAQQGKPPLVWALGSRMEWRTGSVSRVAAGERIEAWQGRDEFAVEIASGAAMLVRRAVFEQIGLFDEAFFLYYEETDWCLRAQMAGHAIYAAPSAVAWHHVSAALGADSPVVDYYMLRNHLRLIDRHATGSGRARLWTRIVLRNLATIGAYTLKPPRVARRAHRNARLCALRDAFAGRWGKMGDDVEQCCQGVR
ncbi:glycosyltransferase family 2 protein [Caldilinea sp.]|uniref:glycosyltransferase family 2 protein n=1 Tax=Caldilinea sp. TaxID=2293560 RepID=UPI002B80A6FE|nr:glycosyltransferase family 2 protein [Anaerolineales bacterium]HQY93240.1 glycosyltransferase family 2 protein [Caldilinea sp.]HRA68360.1 glycosyltransferase family 2 protein [Caldilinea sp.]